MDEVFDGELMREHVNEQFAKFITSSPSKAPPILVR